MNIKSPLVRALFEGPLDVIGDVHGEHEALESLVERLGYDSEGGHPQGRRMVFLGDLTDRGPDSPGVVRRVRSWVESGRAQVVVGNHELNILRSETKHGNHWFYGQASHHEFGDCAAISHHERRAIRDFFRSLPLALERSDLRIVHAAWVTEAIEACRASDLPVDAAYQTFDDRLRASPVFSKLHGEYLDEMRRLGAALNDPATEPAATAIGPYDEYCQMGNPIRVITSGVERVTDTPFFASGKWRYVTRVPWWHEYPDDIPVLFGHYWRWWDPAVHPHWSKGEPQLFPDDPVGPYMAEHHRAFCVDFSVGSRYRQRRAKHPPPYHGRLAAMRWPERELVYDSEDPGKFVSGSA